MPTRQQVDEQNVVLAEIADELLVAWGVDPADAPLEDLRGAVEDIRSQVAEASSKDGKPFSCRGLGCNACCRGEVAVLRRELEELLPHVDDAALRRAVNTPDVNHPVRARFAVCPLVDPKTGGCTVYENRPIACRAYHVITPAEWCDPRLGTRDVASHALVSASVVAIHVAHEQRHGSGYVLTLGSELHNEARRRGFTEGGR